MPLSKDELAALDPEKTRAIEVQDFVDLDEIDPIYFDSPYYLGPAEGAEKAYSLLAEAMEASGKVAIARFVFRNKEHLAAIRASRRRPDPDHDALRRRGRAAGELEDVLPAEQAEGREERAVEMAEQLIDSLTTDFDPAAYRDEYREELLSLIERKAEGKEIVASEAEEPRGDQGARPDGGAGGEHRRGQGQARRRSRAKAARRRSAKRQRRQSKATKPKQKLRRRAPKPKSSK